MGDNHNCYILHVIQLYLLSVCVNQSQYRSLNVCFEGFGRKVLKVSAGSMRLQRWASAGAYDFVSAGVQISFRPESNITLVSAGRYRRFRPDPCVCSKRFRPELRNL